MCLLAFLAEGHTGFNLWDEGYLWYGVQRVLHGEVPIRDFMSYDPGRYYWAAAWLRIFHDEDLVVVRAATAAFSALGVVAAGILVWRGSICRGVARLALCAFAMALCLLWMVPWWKGYDAAISIILTASLARVLVLPIAGRFFQHGMVVGLAAVFGRNHGMYGVLACLLATPVLVFAAKPIWRRCIPAWIAGVALGFSPVLLAIVFNRSFAVAFWDSIRFLLFEYKGTDLPLPVPWPWTVVMAHQSLSTLIRPSLIGCCFVGLPLFCVAGVARALRGACSRRELAQPQFVACVATAIPYLNVAFARADVSHLAQAILPCLLGLLVWPYHARVRRGFAWIGLPLLAAGTSWIILPLHPAYAMRIEGGWRQLDVGGDILWMNPSAATSVADIEELARRYVPPGKTILSVPVWPGAYALLGVRSPVYEIYPLLPRNDEFQEQEIARLRQASPALIILNDIGVDSDERLRYAHTHQRIWSYIEAHYRRIASPPDEPQLKIYLPDVGG
ncbi:hypothetical protein [Rhodanobacter hydrolyticus]|uniref:Glycosyltransferase RgtA/B/C/D-like domain-containing protein n=1 Tax=Rhodanobacter hydrolyticus TaxID=2250595 RepID=A0ABW8JB89_9GAMM